MVPAQERHVTIHIVKVYTLQVATKSTPTGHAQRRSGGRARGDSPAPSAAQTRPGSAPRADAEVVHLPAPHPSSGAAGGGADGATLRGTVCGTAVHATGVLGRACKWAAEAGARRTPRPTRTEDRRTRCGSARVAQAVVVQL